MSSRLRTPLSVALLMIVGLLVVAAVVDIRQTTSGGGSSASPTPAATATAVPPTPTATPTRIPPPVAGHLPAVRMAWLGYDAGSACDQPSPIGVTYLYPGDAAGCDLPDADIDAGEGAPLGQGIAHFAACPGTGGHPQGRYVLLSPDGETGPPDPDGLIDRFAPEYRDWTYPAPQSITIDDIDQRDAFQTQARIVHYHDIPYRAYVSARELDCRLLTGQEAFINPHPPPTPTPTPEPTPTPAPTHTPTPESPSESG